MKQICVVVLVSVAVSFLLFLVLLIFFDKRPPEETSTSAIEDYAQTTEDMKPKACENIYNSVCEDYLKTHNELMSKEVYTKQKFEILNVLNNLDNLNYTSRSVSIVRIFYSTCLKLDPAEEVLKKILEIFSNSGGFPVLERSGFHDSNWSWLETTRKLRRFGLFTDFFFTTKLGSNPLDLRNTTFYIKHPRLDLAQRDYCGKGHECMVSFVFEFLEVVMRYGALREVAITDGIELYSLEKYLLHMIWENPTTPKEFQAEDRVRTLGNMSSSFGFVNWSEYFSILLGSQEQIMEDLLIVVECPGYLESLKRVFEHSPKRVLANCMMWSVLLHLEEYTPGYRRDSLECFKFIQNKMSLALQSLYSKTIKFGSTKPKETVVVIVSRIKEQLLEWVKSANWMSLQVKTEVTEKVEKMQIKVGYPQILLNSTFIDEYYGKLSLHDNALESMLAVHKFHIDKYFQLCCKLVDEVFWDLSVDPFLPAVYYDGAYNCIHVLQGFLRAPLFHAGRSMSEHFGRLGSVVAHEMVHAVDTIGYRYDVNGKRKDSYDEWFLVEFKNKSQCFVDQYNSFMEFTEEVLLQNPRISGESKKLEIMADSIGLDLSFAAYKSYRKTSNEPDVGLKNTSFTQEQEFFVSFAQFFCVKYSDGELFQVLLDDHAPNPYRASAAFNNSENFREAFHCEFPSAMKSCRMQ